MSRELDHKLLVETQRVSRDVIHGVARLVEAGADPNALDRTPNDFRSALGNLVIHAHANAVREILNSGACVHWPDREIEDIALSGSLDKAYEGYPVDALGINMDQLGWALDQALLLETDMDEDTVIGERMEILDLLLRAGANPTWEDPATCRQPAEAFLTGFEQTGGAWSNPNATLSPHLVGLVADVVERLLAAAPDAAARAAQVSSDIAAGRWEALPDGWHRLSVYPAATTALRARAQERQLNTGTAPALRRAGPSVRL